MYGILAKNNESHVKIQVIEWSDDEKSIRDEDLEIVYWEEKEDAYKRALELANGNKFWTYYVFYIED